MNATASNHAQHPKKPLTAVTPPSVQAIASVTTPIGPFPDRTAIVGVPWLPSNGYVTRRFDGKMTQRQGVALRLIHEGIKETGAKIHSPTDALRYVLDKIADEIGISPTGDFPGRLVTPR